MRSFLGRGGLNVGLNPIRCPSGGDIVNLVEVDVVVLVLVSGLPNARDLNCASTSDVKDVKSVPAFAAKAR